MGKRTESDESYILDLCDQILDCKAQRQHRFPFLRGDSGHALPVDAYYPALSLVIEYCERQHTSSVPLFDRRLTVSGVTRGEQRTLYDARRRAILPRHGLRLVEFDYSEFAHTGRRKLLRVQEDRAVVRRKLSAQIVLQTQDEDPDRATHCRRLVPDA
jgi:hypothetical protein